MTIERRSFTPGALGRLGLGLALAAVSQTVAASAQSSYELSSSPDRVVLQLTEDVGIRGADDTPLVRVYGDGRVAVHFPDYMRRAGDYELTLPESTVQELVQTAVDTLLTFDAGATESEVLALEAAERSGGLIVDVSDEATTILEVRFERYRPEGAAEDPPRRRQARRVDGARRRCEPVSRGRRPAGAEQDTTTVARPGRSSGLGGGDAALTRFSRVLPRVRPHRRRRMNDDGTFPGNRAPAGRPALLRIAVAVLTAAVGIGTSLAPRLYSWAYIFAGDRWGTDVVAHPPGYRGDGGTVRVTVGIDPTSPHAQEMVPSVRNIVATFNGLRPTTGNLVLGAGNNVPASYIDFESVALHEVGHALGLAHPNAATESDLPREEQDYTKATKGPNGRFDLDPGSDAVIGSSDDVRGDDVNLHWFRRSNNNPFTIAGTVDSTSYTRDTADLPAGHRFAANADQTVGSRLGVANTEAVMQQGTGVDEAQRTLGHDDVAGLRYAMSGVDGRVGTADDYALVLEYAGLDANADIVIKFDDSKAAFAAAETRALVGGGQAFIVESKVYFNDSFNWFFNGAGGTGGGGGPDLVVDSAAVSDRTLTLGQSFSFSATVRNIGDARSPATTLSYRRRKSGGSFRVVDTDSVRGLSPSGTSEESVRLTAPAQVGTYEYEACAAAVSGESDTGNNYSTIVSVTVSPDGGGSCTNDLGLVTTRVTRSGAWDGSCESVHYPFGEYARYYTFRLGRAASVTIDLTSPSVDTWLALRNGSGTGTGLVEYDNDDGAGTNARITRTLTPGTYTIEATTLLGG